MQPVGVVADGGACSGGGGQLAAGGWGAAVGFAAGEQAVASGEQPGYKQDSACCAQTAADWDRLSGFGDGRRLGEESARRLAIGVTRGILAPEGSLGSRLLAARFRRDGAALDLGVAPTTREVSVGLWRIPVTWSR